MKTIAVALFCSILLAETASDADKLKIRETQLAMAQLANQYRDMQAALDKQIAELSRKLGCPVDPQSLECPAKAAPPKP